MREPADPTRLPIGAVVRRVALCAALWCGAGVTGRWAMHRPTVDAAPLAPGLTYWCTSLEANEQGSGLAHVVRVDLAHPGVELFVTPMDRVALEHGYQYRLRYVHDVAREHGLAVAVNGALFQTAERLLLIPGLFAAGGETVIADGQVNHIDEHSYLVWFDENLQPHAETHKPPPTAALARARFGLGGQQVIVRDGQPVAAGREPDRRTLLAIDEHRRYLWLAVFENCSYSRAAEFMARGHGVRWAIMLDGGDSTAMTVHGDVMLSLKPVASVVGVRVR